MNESRVDLIKQVHQFNHLKAEGRKLAVLFTPAEGTELLSNSYRHLPRNCNQALQIGQYAIDFCRNNGGNPASSVFERTELFHLDSVACGLSALSWGANAPTVLRTEALQYPRTDDWGVPCFGSKQRLQPEKAIVANCAAVREWDSNGTNFGFNPARNATRGEFGHNDFYPVAVAGAQIGQWDGV